ncbi:MAG: hypothetical protein HOP33_22905, partial [Verrucomicrobia bacterium]|nr:hypothetical protein [Verrucomicrobiota bacterium]
WLTKARERGGIDLAVGQWLISQGHEVLWLGHSRTEFGKDIISVDPEGKFHAYQIKDEDINLDELRKIRAQVNELVEVPIVHPRVPPGSRHVAHLVTSGLINEVATIQIRASNEGWLVRGLPTVEPIDRNSLIPRFLAMSDEFWPERPADIREFFSFYLAEGRGDFDPKKFGGLLRGLLPLQDEPERRKVQRLAAVGLLGNYLLNAFERETDHWSVFRGWIMIAAYQAWFATRSELPQKSWRDGFDLSIQAAKERLKALSNECLQPDGFRPQGFEFDDYTRARNLVLGSVLAASSLVGAINSTDEADQRKTRLKMLIEQDRLFLWGESAVPHILSIQWFWENQQPPMSAISLIEEVVAALCERNHVDSDDIPFPPPRVSADEILAELITAEKPKEKNRRSPDPWSLEPLLHFLARRNSRTFLSNHWRAISKLDMVSFQPSPKNDGLLWDAPEGHEADRKPEKEQSWTKLRDAAAEDRANELPDVLRENPKFALMYFLAYPHRISPALVGFLDRQFGRIL